VRHDGSSEVNCLGQNDCSAERCRSSRRDRSIEKQKARNNLVLDIFRMFLN